MNASRPGRKGQSTSWKEDRMLWDIFKLNVFPDFRNGVRASSFKHWDPISRQEPILGVWKTGVQLLYFFEDSALFCKTSGTTIAGSNIKAPPCEPTDVKWIGAWFMLLPELRSTRRRRKRLLSRAERLLGSVQEGRVLKSSDHELNVFEIANQRCLGTFVSVSRRVWEA